jgi:hypothetical protein
MRVAPLTKRIVALPPNMLQSAMDRRVGTSLPHHEGSSSQARVEPLEMPCGQQSSGKPGNLGAQRGLAHPIVWPICAAILQLIIASILAFGSNLKSVVHFIDLYWAIMDSCCTVLLHY